MMNGPGLDIGASRARVCDAVYRASELVFALFMALTFAGTVGGVAAGP
jgi:hypothetical protein